MNSYQMTANIYATVSVYEFIEGIGTIYSENFHFRLMTNATDGSKISQEWVD